MSSKCPFVLVIMHGMMNKVSMSLAKVLVVLNPSKRSGQKLYLDNRSSIEFETSSNRSLPLAVNNELQMPDCLAHHARYDEHGVFVAYIGRGGAHLFEKVGPKTVSSVWYVQRIRDIEQLN
jgi:hypothetical protein